MGVGFINEEWSLRMFARIKNYCKYLYQFEFRRKITYYFRKINLHVC